MEAVPDVRMETEDRQSTEYEVHHQKLVNTHNLPSYTSLDSDLTSHEAVSPVCLPL